MITQITKRRSRGAYKALSAFIAFTFIFTTILPPGYGSTALITGAQSVNLLNLPAPGVMVPPSQAFVPVLLKGMTIHPEDPLKFDFIIDTGNTTFAPDEVKAESERLVKYFLASLTVPKDDLWVNLSPYEDDRIIPDELGKTELGRDMLAQDYILKQLTASLMYPEEELGKKFWDKVYRKAEEQFGTSEIPVNTFNKVWILPETATVYEHEQTVYVVESRLKVMLDEDYLAMDFQQKSTVGTGLKPVPTDTDLSVSTAIIREIIIPAIEREVNEGKNFAPLRQIYHSLILAKWYKETIKESLLSKVYVDQNKIMGVNIDDETIKDQIYDRYIAAYKKGVFNYIREDYDKLSQEMIPRKYFSGGLELYGNVALSRSSSPVIIPTGPQFSATVRLAKPTETVSSPVSPKRTEFNYSVDVEWPDDGIIKVTITKAGRQESKEKLTLHDVREKVYSFGWAAKSKDLRQLKMDLELLTILASVLKKFIGDHTGGNTAGGGNVALASAEDHYVTTSLSDADELLELIQQVVYDIQDAIFVKTVSQEEYRFINDFGAIHMELTWLSGSILISGPRDEVFTPAQALQALRRNPGWGLYISDNPDKAPLYIGRRVEPTPSSSPIAWLSTRTIQGHERHLNVARYRAGTRRRAIRELGKIARRGNMQAVGPLMKGLRDRNWQNREAAIEVFKNLDLSDQRKKVIYHLMEWLGEPDENVRGAALKTLENLKVSKAQMVDRHMATLLSRDGGTRNDSARALGNLGDTRAVAPLLKQLRKERRPDVRGRIAEALGELGDTIAVDPLIKLLEDPDPKVRRTAAEALGNLGDERAVDPLMELLGDDDRWVSIVAAKALKNLGAPDDQMVGKYISALSSPKERVRRHAAEMLGNLDLDGGQREKVIVLLLERLGDPDENVRSLTAEALRNQGAPDAQMVDGYISALSSSDGNVRKDAAEALGRLDLGHRREEVIDSLKKWLRDDWWDPPVIAETLRKLGVTQEQMVDEYINLLSFSDVNVVGYAATMLGRLKDRRAAVSLTQLLSHEDWRIRKRGAEALGALGDESEKVIGPLRERSGIDSEPRVVIALAKALMKLGRGDIGREILDGMGEELVQASSPVSTPDIEGPLLEEFSREDRRLPAQIFLLTGDPERDRELYEQGQTTFPDQEYPDVAKEKRGHFTKYLTDASKGLARFQRTSAMVRLNTFLSYLAVDAPTLRQLESIIYEFIKRVTGNRETYLQRKSDAHDLAPALYKKFEKELRGTSVMKLFSSLMIALQGNRMGSGRFHASYENGGDALRNAAMGLTDTPIEFDQDDRDYLVALLRTDVPKHILYTLDNVIEDIHDLAAVRVMLRLGHTVTLAAKAEEADNDTTVQDLERLLSMPATIDFIGAENMKRLKIVSTGSATRGMDPFNMSDEYIEAWERADIVILKGEGNRDTLDTALGLTKKNVFAMVYAKADYNAREVSVGKAIIQRIGTAPEASSPVTQGGFRGMLTHDQIQHSRLTKPILADINMDSVKKGEIEDMFKIEEGLRGFGEIDHPMTFLTHNGRPQTKGPEGLEIAVLKEVIEKALPGKEVILANGLFGPEVDIQLASLKNNQILLLTNFRLDPRAEAQENDVRMSLIRDITLNRDGSQKFSVYISNSFASAPRIGGDSPSTRILDIPKILPSVIGPLMVKELEMAQQLDTFMQHRFLAMLGGSKIGDKIDVMKNLLKKMQAGHEMVIYGQMAYTFLKARDDTVDLGESLVRNDYLDQAREILDYAAQQGITVILPRDHVEIVPEDIERWKRKEIEDITNTVGTEGLKISKGKVGGDIGHRSFDDIVAAIERAEYIFYNGTPGIVEVPSLAVHSLALATALASAVQRGKVVYSGGGDANKALRMAKVEDIIEMKSTGGGSLLQILGLSEGEEWSPIIALGDADERTRKALAHALILRESASSPILFGKQRQARQQLHRLGVGKISSEVEKIILQNWDFLVATFTENFAIRYITYTTTRAADNVLAPLQGTETITIPGAKILLGDQTLEQVGLKEREYTDRIKGDSRNAAHTSTTKITYKIRPELNRERLSEFVRSLASLTPDNAQSAIDALRTDDSVKQDSKTGTPASSPVRAHSLPGGHPDEDSMYQMRLQFIGLVLDQIKYDLEREPSRDETLIRKSIQAMLNAKDVILRIEFLDSQKQKQIITFQPSRLAGEAEDIEKVAHVVSNAVYQAKDSKGYFPIIRVDFDLLGAAPIILNQSVELVHTIESQSAMIFDTRNFQGNILIQGIMEDTGVHLDMRVNISERDGYSVTTDTPSRASSVKLSPSDPSFSVDTADQSFVKVSRHGEHNIVIHNFSFRNSIITAIDAASSPIEAMLESIKPQQVDLLMESFERRRVSSLTPEEWEFRLAVQKGRDEIISQELAIQLDATNDIRVARKNKVFRKIAQFAKKFGGMTKLGPMKEAILMTEIGMASQSVDLTVDVWMGLTLSILEKYGTADQKERFLDDLENAKTLWAYALSETDSASDSSNMKARATKGKNDRENQYRLNGSKMWITDGAIAGYTIIFAITDEEAHKIKHSDGITAFIVPMDAQGVEVSPIDVAGQKGTGTSEIALDDVWVSKENILGEEGKGFKIAMEALDSGRIAVQSIILSSLEVALEEVQKKYQVLFNQGAPQQRLQEMQQAIAEMMSDADTARLLLNDAVRAKEKWLDKDEDEKDNHKFTLQAATAKLLSAEDAVNNIARAIELVGPEALRKGHILERVFRDTKVLAILEGTTQIMKLVVGRELTKAFLAANERKKASIDEVLEARFKDMPDEIKKPMSDLIKHYRAEMKVKGAEIESAKKRLEQAVLALEKSERDPRELSAAQEELAKAEYISRRIEIRMINLFAQGRAIELMQKEKAESDEPLAQALYRFSLKRTAAKADQYVSEVEAILKEERPVEMLPENWSLMEQSVEGNAKRRLMPLATADKSEEKLDKEVRIKNAIERRQKALKTLFPESEEDRLIGISLDDENKEMGLDESIRDQILRTFAQGVGVDGEDGHGPPSLGDPALAHMILEQEKGMAALKEFGEKELLANALRGERIMVEALHDFVDKKGNIETTTAQESDGEFQINGKKHFVINGAMADTFIVFAFEEKGLSAFLVEADQSGVEVTLIDGLALQEAGMSDVKFVNAKAILLGERGKGLKVLKVLSDVEQGGYRGISKGSSTYLEKKGEFYATEIRDAFGQRINNFADVRQMHEETHDNVARMDKKDARPARLHQENTERIVQLHGGLGFSEEDTVARFWRTSEVMRTLELARKYAYADVARESEAASSPVSDRERQISLFLWTAGIGDIQGVKMFLDNGFPVDALGPYYATPLTEAAQRGHVAVVNLLIDWDANVNHLMGQDLTPLIVAAGNNQAEVAEVLLNNGADMHAETRDGTTALDIARRKGYVEVTELLVREEEKRVRQGVSALIDGSRVLSEDDPRGAGPGSSSRPGSHESSASLPMTGSDSSGMRGVSVTQSGSTIRVKWEAAFLDFPFRKIETFLSTLSTFSHITAEAGTAISAGYPIIKNLDLQDAERFAVVNQALVRVGPDIYQLTSDNIQIVNQIGQVLGSFRDEDFRHYLKLKFYAALVASTALFIRGNPDSEKRSLKQALSEPTEYQVEFKEDEIAIQFAPDTLIKIERNTGAIDIDDPQNLLIIQDQLRKQSYINARVAWALADAALNDYYPLLILPTEEMILTYMPGSASSPVKAGYAQSLDELNREGKIVLGKLALVFLPHKAFKIITRYGALIRSGFPAVQYNELDDEMKALLHEFQVSDVPERFDQGGINSNINNYLKYAALNPESTQFVDRLLGQGLLLQEALDQLQEPESAASPIEPQLLHDLVGLGVSLFFVIAGSGMVLSPFIQKGKKLLSLANPELNADKRRALKEELKLLPLVQQKETVHSLTRLEQGVGEKEQASLLEILQKSEVPEKTIERSMLIGQAREIISQKLPRGITLDAATEDNVLDAMRALEDPLWGDFEIATKIPLPSPAEELELSILEMEEYYAAGQLQIVPLRKELTEATASSPVDATEGNIDKNEIYPSVSRAIESIEKPNTLKLALFLTEAPYLWPKTAELPVDSTKIQGVEFPEDLRALLEAENFREIIDVFYDLLSEFTLEETLRDVSGWIMRDSIEDAYRDLEQQGSLEVYHPIMIRIARILQERQFATLEFIRSKLRKRDEGEGKPTVSEGGKVGSSPVSLDEDVGGIDMNAINVNRQGAGVDIQFDPVELQNILEHGVDGFAPVIINFVPLPSVLPLLGLEPRDREKKFEVSKAN